jgi:hypothetical protein
LPALRLFEEKKKGHRLPVRPGQCPKAARRALD